MVQGRRHRQGINHVWERREIYKNFSWKEERKIRRGRRGLLKTGRYEEDYIKLDFR
jgi:hypothetical protein